MQHNYYLYFISIFVSIGGFLFGYDTGIISGTIVTPSFLTTFGPLSSIELGAVVSSLILGCLIGSIVGGFISDSWGRKSAISLSSVCVVIGGFIQALSVNSVWMIYVGRFVAGLGIGTLSMVVPLYQAEIASSRNRGRIVTFHQLSITIGLAAAFWINFGCGSLQENGLSWRLPLGLQVIPALILGVGCIFLPASPRWLIFKDRNSDALRILADLRSWGNLDDPDMIAEYNLIKYTVDEEKKSKSNSISELFKGTVRQRIALGILVQIFQQLTGINAILYFAPILFLNIGLQSVDASLLAQATNGLVNVLFTLPALFLLDSWGRKTILVSGAVIMALAMTTLTLLLGIYSTTDTEINLTDNLAVSYSIIGLVYLFVAAFACSWGPIGWIYPAEIFPTYIRSKAVAVVTASNWIANFLIGLLVPLLLNTIGWKLYIIFSVFCYLMAISVAVNLKETKALALEAMDDAFKDTQEEGSDIIRKRSLSLRSYRSSLNN